MRAAHVVLCALCFIGCGGSSHEAAQPSGGSAAPIAQAPPTPQAAPSGGDALSVHEWGVVDVPVQGPIELAAGPGHPRMDMPMRKPVLYFHLAAGAGPLDVNVGVDVPHGGLSEVFPFGTRQASSIAWTTHVARCAPNAPSAHVPAACQSTDGYCESADLADYETTDADCLDVAGTSARLLFYRGVVPRTSLPLDAAVSGGHWVMRSTAPSTGTVIYMMGDRGIEVSWPAPGTDGALPDAFTESFDGTALVRVLSRQLSAAGLTQPEIDAFMRAWSQPFFGVAPPARELTDPSRRGPVARDMMVPGAALIYVMPAATVQNVSALSIAPVPHELRRAMVVRVALPSGRP